MLLIQFEIIFITITYIALRYCSIAEKDCLKPKWSPGVSFNVSKQVYVKVLGEEQREKSYNISDRFEIMTRFNFKIPCGTMEYDPASAISGGQEAPDKAWPWQTRVFATSTSCGGVLIDSQWVLTAAHCVANKDANYFVKLGSSTLGYGKNYVVRWSRFVVQHKDYDKYSLKNDIALIKMSLPVDFTDRVRPACLPVYGEDFIQNDFCYITGFGAKMKGGEKEDLQQLKVYVVPNMECAYLSRTYYVRTDWQHICTGRVRQTGGSCFGDSGGPLSCKIGNKYYVAGISSSNPGKCTHDIVPDGYMKVTKYINWIFHILDTFKDI